MVVNACHGREKVVAMASMLFWTWFTVDGCYWLYWHFKNPVAFELMREANAPASRSLYWMCGLVGYHRGTLRER